MLKRDPSDICEHCPAWAKHYAADGSEALVEARGMDGHPVTKDGLQQYEKSDDGRFVMQGSCRLRAPQVFQTPQGFITQYPTPKSNWWCEDPLRHEMLERIAKGGGDGGAHGRHSP